MYWNDVALLFGRALRLRCPVCGRGALFRTWFGMYERCSSCDYRYDRGEEGYFTGAMAINLVATELVLAVVVIPLAVLLAARPGLLPLVIGLGITLPILLPVLGFRHTRSCWMALDLILHPREP